MRKVLSVPMNNSLQQIRSRLLQWGASFEYFMLLDSNSDAGYDRLPTSYVNYHFLAAAGVFRGLLPDQNVFRSIKQLIAADPEWYFLHLTFNVKAETHKVYAKHEDPVGFPAAFVFSPLWLILVREGVLELHYPSQVSDDEALSALEKLLQPAREYFFGDFVKQRISISYPTFDEYRQVFERVQGHLGRGDIYEMNYCINFIGRDAVIDPRATYLKLADYSPAPFAAFYKYRDLYLLSASPERFLKKTGMQVISQPIKGTIRRGKGSSEDEELKKYLQNNAKDRSENIMITDLVRNDMSQFAQAGTVKVSDLCGVYSFRHVHQMISTIECRLSREVSAVDAIRLAFPMGSMTGAPKRNALRYIEEYESFNRGLFSGTVGYITPEGDFDLNVVIRSILYNASQRLIAIPAGSAVTVQANAGDEYDECCLKAQALIDILS